MATVQCKDLGGPSDCVHEVVGESFQEMAENCKKHVMQEMQAGEATHVEAIQKMQNAAPEEQQAMMAGYQKVCEEALAA